jgi:crotonobetainyl-CoA:carnitine CoA-transferase CaiB-like acyl-CoA transferase
MHERGMLEWIDHPDLGRIVVPNSPLRFHEADHLDTVPSPRIGQHNDEVYGEWLGLKDDEIEKLRDDGVI